MTQHEVEKWATRLARIWQIDLSKLEWEQDPCVVWGFEEDYVFEGPINEDVRFICWVNADLFRISSRRFDTALDCSKGVLLPWNHHDHNAPPVPSFVSEWISFFRHGCWLSGCDIEATAHEKAQWIQGFTQEEIEAWNLKF